MGYVEMHTHIIPGIDDGADTPQTALKMIWQAYMQGIDTIVLTPHYCPGRNFRASPGAINAKAMRLQAAVQSKISEDIQIYTGQEIFWNSNVVDMLNRGELLTMANTSYVLIEFAVAEPIERIQEAIDQLTISGYLPIIAHIERYHNLTGRFAEVKELIRRGAYMQINCHSLTGGRFEREARFCKRLFEQQLVHFISSDCHDIRYRAPAIKDAVKVLEKKQGKQWFQKVFFEHPKALLKGEEIER